MARQRRTDEEHDARHAQEQAELRQRRAAIGREIGPLPPVEDPDRRQRADDSLRFFLESYFPGTFALEWSPDHLEVIEQTERVIRDGGQMALAMPRGSGKSSISIRAAIWALLTGRRRFVVLIAAEAVLAQQLLVSINRELEGNELLRGDYPEVCYPLYRLGPNSKYQKQDTQLLDGANTSAQIKADRITLPTVSGSLASGATVKTLGLTGSIRGQVVTTLTGETIRPDLVLVDDPQTRESAGSRTQVEQRLKLLNSDVLELAGPGRKIACVTLVTVVEADDLADQILDREHHPAWCGKKYQALKSLPSDLPGWDEYAARRQESLRVHGDNRLGNQFYLENRPRLDAGAVAGWEARFNADEQSAIQSAMNVRIDRPEAFASEYQNDPRLAERPGERKEYTPAEVVRRTSGIARGIVPSDCTRLTAFIDLGGAVHWWGVVAWNEHFGGSVIDYGPWPRQPRLSFTAATAHPSFKTLYPKHTEEQRVYAGLQALTPEVVDKAYRGQTGLVEYRVERCLIDAGKWPDVVHKFITASKLGAVLMASKGFGRSETQAGVNKWAMRTGEVRGPHWRITAGTTGRGRQCQFDPDHWKTFVFDALTVPPGGKSDLTLYGDNPNAHTLLADHLAAEVATRKELKGDTFDKWEKPKAHVDNHYLDVLTGCAVAASVLGLRSTPFGIPHKPAAPTKPKPIPLPHERKQITPKRMQLR